jgi:hypothetical protein
MPLYHAFINREALKESGLRLEDIDSPYDIWNNPVLKIESHIFDIFDDGKPNKDQMPEYKKLNADPKYVRVDVSCGN